MKGEFVDGDSVQSPCAARTADPSICITPVQVAKVTEVDIDNAREPNPQRAHACLKVVQSFIMFYSCQKA